GAHYGTTGLLSFYMPEAQTNVSTDPLIFFQTSSNAVNQFYFWPGYEESHKGQNALYVRELPAPSLVKGTRANWYQDNWFFQWLKGAPMEDLVEPYPGRRPTPDIIQQEFDSVTDLGLYEVHYRGRVFHTIHIFECRNLR